MTSHFWPPTTRLRQRPWGLRPLGPGRRGRVSSEEKELDPCTCMWLSLLSHRILRSHVFALTGNWSPWLAALTACEDLDILCWTCFRSDQKQISWLATHSQSASTDCLYKYNIPCRYSIYKYHCAEKNTTLAFTICPSGHKSCPVCFPFRYQNVKRPQSYSPNNKKKSMVSWRKSPQDMK